MNLNLDDTLEILCPLLSKVPKNWDGKKSILEMKENGAKNWKQMEWIGWFFEYWCQNNLNSVMEMPFGKKYGNVSFDGFLKIPWDFKSHAIESGNIIPVNDHEAISNAIIEYGCVGLILVIGSVSYDNLEGDFKKWHDNLKGGKSNYELARIKRGAISRKRKIDMSVSKIHFLKIDNDLLTKSGSFQKNFRNANGNERREKVSLDLNEINSHIIYTIDFLK